MKGTTFMPSFIEPVFSILYLVITCTLAILMIKNSKSIKEVILFGIASLVLVVGDSFHLVPRIYGGLTQSMDTLSKPLAFGTLVASISMTIFYILIYFVWKQHYKIKENKSLDMCIYCLAAIRVILCLLPQNNWFAETPSLAWGIIRNIPFTIIGIIIIILFFAKRKSIPNDKFKYMWLAVCLSFLFYLPVVLFAKINPMFGIFMLPKTIAYVWIVFMGYNNMKLFKK